MPEDPTTTGEGYTGRWAHQCTAPSRSTGNRCGNPAIPGGTTCRVHGGATPVVKAAAQRRLAEAKATRELQAGLAAAYGNNVPDIPAADAMVRAVSWKYAEVLALRAKVAELDDDERVWGITRQKTGGDDHGTTTEARPNVWWTMLRQAEEQLVKFAAAARAAGCDEARVRIAEQQGSLIADALKGILAAMLTVVLDLVQRGAPPETVEVAWADAVGEVVPKHLRALAGGAS